MAEFKRVSSADNPIFQFWYEELCKDWGMETDLEFCTQEHCERVFERLVSAQCFDHKGTYVKWGRWCSFFDVGQQFKVDWTARDVSMFNLGFRSGWWSSWLDSPMGIEQKQDAALKGAVAFGGGAQVSGAASGDRAPPKSVRESNAAVKTVRSACKNTLHLACTIMSNMVTKRLFLIILEVCGPVRIFMGTSIADMGVSSRAGLEVYQKWAETGAVEMTKQVFRRLYDADALRRCRFLFLASISKDEPDGPVMDEEDEMARWMFRLAVEVVGQRAVSMYEYTDSLPLLFVLLLHDQADIVAATVEKLKGLWGALQKIERLGFKDSWFSSFAASLVWPSLTTVRSIFVGLEELRWSLSADLTSRLLRLFSGILHTKPVEELFNYLGDASMKSKSKGIGKMLMWQLAMQSPNFDQWGHERARKTSASEMAAPSKLPKNLFQSDAEGFSLGRGVLDTLSDSD